MFEMDDDTAVIYGIEYQVRIMAAKTIRPPIHTFVSSVVVVVFLTINKHFNVITLRKTRALCAQTAETEIKRFLVGTQSLKFVNQVCNITC